MCGTENETKISSVQAETFITMERAPGLRPAQRIATLLAILLLAGIAFLMRQRMPSDNKFVRAATQAAAPETDVCGAVLKSGTAAAVCPMQEAVCGCKPDLANTNVSRYAVILSGGLRSFAAASFSLQKFVLEVNSPIDVFIYGTHKHGAPQDELNLEVVRNLATVYVLEPLREVPVRAHNDSSVPERMIWQWEAIAHAFELAMAYAEARSFKYELIMRSRPDTVFFSPLDLAFFSEHYHELGLYRPYFSTQWFDVKPELERTLPQPYLPKAVVPLFFPSCLGFGGVNDR